MIANTTRNGQSRPSPVEMAARPIASHEKLERHAFRFGRSYDSYLVIDPGRRQFWARDGSGVVVYVQLGKHLHVGGGLLAPSMLKEQLLREFVEFAGRHRCIASFYNIAPDELELFRRFGFQVTKWGEDALIDLADCSWEGRGFQWVRRQTNYCRRKGLFFSECDYQRLPTTIQHYVAKELLEISAARLDTKPQLVESSFLDGRFDPEVMGRKRVFLARSSRRIEGCVICNPCLNGAEWALDVYRQRSDAPRGTVAFLIHQTLDLLKTEGCDRASLCLVPALRCRDRLTGDSRLIRWGLTMSRYSNAVFDLAGLYHFKSRFRPRFESRYVCVLPKATVGSIWTFMQLCGVLELSPNKLFRVAWDHWEKQARRQTLATSD